MTKLRTGILAAPAILLVGMLAWMVLAQLREHADNRSDPERDQCISNLALLKESTQMWWELEHKPPGAVPTPKELDRFVRGRSLEGKGYDLLVCPRGGSYLLRSTEEVPECSYGVENPASGHHLTIATAP